MKTKLMIIIFILITGVFMLNIKDTYAQNLNLRIGASSLIFNNLKIEDDLDGEVIMDGFDKGYGFYIGSEFIISDSLKGILQYEKLLTSDSIREKDYFTDEYYRITMGFNVNGVVGLISFPDLVPDNNEFKISLIGGVGYYFSDYEIERVDLSQKFSVEMNSSLGFKVGLDIEQQIQDNLNINISSFYRILEKEMNLFDEEMSFDFSGFEFSGGFLYKFN